MTPNARKTVSARVLLRQASLYLGCGLVMTVGLLFLAVLVMRITGPIYAVQQSGILKTFGPMLLLALIATIVAIWHFWEPLVRSRNLPAQAMYAWIQARNRVAFWGLAYASLGAYLLFIR